MATGILDLAVRVSKMDQRDEDDTSTITIRDQIESGTASIAARGKSVGRVVKALDNSGWSVWSSPAWTELLDRVKRGESDGFAIAYDDRLGRNWRKAGRFFDDAEEAGAEILIANIPGVDYRTDDGRTMTGILAVVAERQYLTARNRGNAIAADAMKRGVPNALAYGYRRNADADGVKSDPTKDAKAAYPDRTLAYVDCSDDRARSRADVVGMVFAWRYDGWKVADIVNELNFRNVPSARGGRWVKSSIAHMLRNRQYLGEVKLAGKTKRPVVKGAHEPLVDADVFKDVNDGFVKVQRNGNLVAGIAGGILTCHACGNTLSVINSGGPERPNSYACRREGSTWKCARPVAVKMPFCDDYVEALVLEALGGNMKSVASARRTEQLRADVKTTTKELEAFVENTPATSRAYAMGIAKREAAVDAAESALADALSHADRVSNVPTPDAWSKLDDAEKSRVARLLLPRVVVVPPLSRSKFAPIADRLKPIWANDGEDVFA